MRDQFRLRRLQLPRSIVSVAQACLQISGPHHLSSACLRSLASGILKSTCTSGLCLHTYIHADARPRLKSGQYEQCKENHRGGRFM